MTTVLQANLARGWTAQALLQQHISENGIDICLLSEQHSNASSHRWISDISGTAAIWIVNTDFPILDTGSSDGFVWAKLPGYTLFSCYLSPNEGISIFRHKLSELEGAVRQTEGEIIVAGDLNAKSTEWGMDRSDTRGNDVSDMAARLDLVIINEGNTTTFRRPGYRETIIDITFATPNTAAAIRNWRVMEDYNASDHQYIQFVIAGAKPDSANTKHQRKGWNEKKLDEAKLINFLKERWQPTHDAANNTRSDAETLVEKTMGLITAACDASMPAKSNRARRRPNYWWTAEINELRTKCLALRRKVTRTNRQQQPGHGTHATEFEQAKKALKKAIKSSKRQGWRNLCAELDEDPWGKAYQIAVKGLGKQGPVPPMEPDVVKKIIKDLFPQHPRRTPREDQKPTAAPPFTIEELQDAASALKPGKAPGPDGVPTSVIKVIAKELPMILLSMYNACLSNGTFSKRWKRQRLVLLDKGKGPPITSSSYRPLCMLDVPGKLLEKLIKVRLSAAVESAGGLSVNQHGFRKQHSTISAIEQALAIVKEAWSGNHRSRKACIFITFDVRNAFNSVGWEDILDALKDDFEVDEYIRDMVSDYFRDRVLEYDTLEGTHTVEVTAGVPQGSVLGPDLWNVRYDDLLREDLARDTYLVGYADDIAGIILANSAEDARQKIGHLVTRLGDWMARHKLKLAASKTELVVLTRQQWFEKPFSINIDGASIVAKHSVRYLGLQLDEKLTFWEHLTNTAEKANKVVAGLSRIMLNTSGPRYAKRRLLLSVVHSIMLYGAEIWADRLTHEKYRRKLASVQRRAALRVACAYRTVSEAATLVITKTVPIDLMAQERKRLYERRAEGTLNDNTRMVERKQTIREWVLRWQSGETGRWTAKLIPEIEEWVDCDHVETGFYLTQLLTGHGLFNAYLHRMGLLDNPMCRYCPTSIDDAHHTFFQCDRWVTERTSAERAVGATLSPENITSLMISSERNWEAIMGFAEGVLKAKKRDEQGT